MDRPKSTLRRIALISGAVVLVITGMAIKAASDRDVADAVRRAEVQQQYRHAVEAATTGR